MLIYHLPVYVLYIFSLTYDIVNIEVGWQGYGGKLKFLTFWNLCIQTLYFGITVLNDFCGSNVRPSEKGQKISSLQKFRDYFLATLVFPVGMHTTIVPFLLVEKYIVYHQYPPRKYGLMTLLGFALLYLVWILWIAYYANIWVYPILKVLQPHQRAVFIIVLLFLFISLYILGESINKFFWGKERSVVQSRKMKNSQKVK
ncbi:unnamed protein product [Mytilus coruscus]|uniref:ADTRP n=1 Tax=Mytilus coruscus TaxID=42192 RepID=A0A6J8APM9_MYTCO|nr:unnamed protein product [Mytilus coruscus]